MVKKVVKSKVKKSPVKKAKKVTKKPVLTSEKYDRDDMVSIDVSDMDGSTLARLKTLMFDGGYGSISEVVRDIFRRLLRGEAPPSALPKMSAKEFANRLKLR